MTLIKFEDFTKAMNWSVINFSEEQLKRIYENINQDYATFKELDKELEIEDNGMNAFMDAELSEIVGYLDDLENEDIITAVLTLPYGYDTRQGDIFYLQEENMYCLVMQ